MLRPRRTPTPSPSARALRPRALARAASLAVGLLAGVAIGASCGGEAPLAPLPPSAEAAALPAADRERLGADLTRFFGSAGAPRFAVLDGWEAAGFDPNAPAPTGRSSELDERIDAANAERWHAALARSAAGEDPASDAMPASLRRALAAADDEGAAATIRTWQPGLTESARLFDRECATCHGRAGGGDGPSSVTLDPKPRDFRTGSFVHRAVGPNPRPTQADLVRVQQRGIAGTGMPLFSRLGAARQSGLADWVRYLSLRGEFERAWLAHRAEHGAPPSTEQMQRVYAEAWSRWAILPGPDSATSNDEPR